MPTPESKVKERFGANNSNYKGYMDRKCQQCNGPIRGSSKTRKYCSVTCYTIAQRVTDYSRTCAWCGKDFLHRSNKHCSVECATAIRTEKRKPKPVNPHKVKTLRACRTCGKGMLLRPSDVKNGKLFCSRECYGKEVGRRQTGENHHNYKHGLTAQKTSERQRQRKHPQYKQWVKAVFARDGHTCRSCGKTGITLNAHHHAPWVEAPKARLKTSNGITLCNECHRLWHLYDRKGLFAKKEAALQEKVITCLRDYGFYVFNVPGTPLGTNGTPDLLVCRNGFFGGLECKVFPNYLSELQKVAGQRIRDAGGIFYVVQSEDDIPKVVELFERASGAGSFVINEEEGMEALEFWLEEVTA